MKYIVLLLVCLSTFSVSCFYKPQSSKIFEGIELNRGYKQVEEPIDLVGDIQHSNPNIEVPDQWLWNNVDGVNFLTNVQTQHQPQYCASSWAMSTTSAINDRIKILREAAFPEIYLSVQVLLSCSYSDFGCLGGDPLSAYKYIKEKQITDQTCSIYQGKGYNNGLVCTDELICGNCVSTAEGCHPIYKYQSYTLLGYGSVSGEEKMMSEIYSRGPITCTIANTLELEIYTGGIFKDTTGVTDANHVVSVVGFGEENGEKYWLVRNTVGEYWGERGYFRIVRGENNLGIEENCSFGVVKDTWGKIFEEQFAQTKLVIDDAVWGPTPAPSYSISEEDILQLDELKTQEQREEEQQGCAFQSVYDQIKEGEGQISSPLPHTYINEDDLPSSFDWRNVDGINYASWSTNQHIPVYCGSCWAQATTSSMADRTNILRQNRFPGTALSVQTVVNCDWGGTCNGGSAHTASEKIFENGCPLYTCQIYEAKNPSLYNCSDYQQCYNCFMTEKGEVCLPVEPVMGSIPKVYLKEYGKVPKGEHEFKSEIYARGPIMCNIESTELFHRYAGGIFKEYIEGLSGTNHVISLLGWGQSESGEKYWIGRNSWGTYWGESGYFKISMNDELNLNITSGCYFLVPDVSNL